MSTQSPQSTETKSTEKFESDTQKIVRRHLENKDDRITDEDIRSVRIGLTPDAADTQQKMQELVTNPATSSNNIQPNNEPTTPWDTIER